MVLIFVGLDEDRDRSPSLVVVVEREPKVPVLFDDGCPLEGVACEERVEVDEE